MSSPRTEAGTARTRRAVSIGSRLVAAGLGGYVVANLFAVSLAAALPGPRAGNVAAAMGLALAAYVSVIVGVFAARSTMRAWAWVCGLALALAALAWLLAAGARA